MDTIWIHPLDAWNGPSLGPCGLTHTPIPGLVNRPDFTPLLADQECCQDGRLPGLVDLLPQGCHLSIVMARSPISHIPSFSLVLLPVLGLVEVSKPKPSRHVSRSSGTPGFILDLAGSSHGISPTSTPGPQLTWTLALGSERLRSPVWP